MSKSFTDTLREINNGKFAEELTEAFADLVLSTNTVGKSGSITLTLKMRPAKGGNGVMTLEHDFKVKSPEFERPVEYMFVANGNTLVRDNPTQRKLDLHEVRNPDAQTVVDPETGEIVGKVAAAA